VGEHTASLCILQRAVALHVDSIALCESPDSHTRLHPVARQHTHAAYAALASQEIVSHPFSDPATGHLIWPRIERYLPEGPLLKHSLL
jgi:hypothetical protein